MRQPTPDIGAVLMILGAKLSREAALLVEHNQ
jgi:hypothetical protein